VTKLLPFFTFYGGKNRAARHYPEPARDLIVEPFAGSAGYSLNYPDRQVLLRDADPVIVATWQYLLGASAADILGLPDLQPGQTTDDLDVPPGARHLIGWWLNKGSATPKRKPSTFMLRYPQGGPYWGPGIRARIARQLPCIWHWRVECASWESAPDLDACWFIDPPYQRAGKHYRHDSDGIDYRKLAEWTRTRRGQVIACEADAADWLPFRPLVAIDGMEGRQKKTRARMEMIWP